MQKLRSQYTSLTNLIIENNEVLAEESLRLLGEIPDYELAQTPWAIEMLRRLEESSEVAERRVGFARDLALVQAQREFKLGMRKGKEGTKVCL